MRVSVIDRARQGVAIRAGLLLVGCSLVWGCASSAAGAQLAISDASRAPGTADEARQAAESLGAFGFDMYGRLDRGTNLVFSPASVYIALSMAAAGARGETASQMDTVLHQSPGAARGNGVNSLDQALAALSRTWKDPAGTEHEVRLNIANAPFAQSGMQLQQDYLDTLASRYGAGLRLVDYRNDPAGATRLINEWISDRTEKRIPKLLDSLDPMTRLVLVNAIYLKAPWQDPFTASQTADAPFERLDGSTVNVPTMDGSIGARYAEGDGWQAVELPYADGSLAMTIVVPSDLATFEDALDSRQFASIVDALSTSEVHLSLPRFETETREDLTDLLVALGMPLAMDPGAADFSGITTEESLFITGVIHQANITVDEKGTEAAAATAVVMGASAMPEEFKELKVDRPFIFALRDTSTGAILFLGRIVDPSAGD
jgi:serine protease inhibitor